MFERPLRIESVSAAATSAEECTFVEGRYLCIKMIGCGRARQKMMTRRPNAQGPSVTVSLVQALYFSYQDLQTASNRGTRGGTVVALVPKIKPKKCPIYPQVTTGLRGATISWFVEKTDDLGNIDCLASPIFLTETSSIRASPQPL